MIPPVIAPGPPQEKFDFGKITSPITSLIRKPKNPIVLVAVIAVPILLVLGYFIYHAISHKATGGAKNPVEASNSAAADNPKQAGGTNLSSATLYKQGEDCYQKKDYKGALSAFKSSDATAVNDKSEWMLGNMYYMGLGVAKSDSTALRWYLKSSEQKNPSAMYAVGLIYANGSTEVKKDVFKAYKYFAWVTENAPDEADRNRAKEKLRLINEQ